MTNPIIAIRRWWTWYIPSLNTWLLILIALQIFVLIINIIDIKRNIEIEKNKHEYEVIRINK